MHVIVKFLLLSKQIDLSSPDQDVDRVSRSQTKCCDVLFFISRSNPVPISAGRLLRKQNPNDSCWFGIDGSFRHVSVLQIDSSSIIEMDVVDDATDDGLYFRDTSHGESFTVLECYLQAHCCLL